MVLVGAPPVVWPVAVLPVTVAVVRPLHSLFLGAAKKWDEREYKAVLSVFPDSFSRKPFLGRII